MGYGFKIMVDANYACFTRPELKVERVSYDVPTPSALEGMIKSIYWKPAIRYVIDKIIVFNPIDFFNIRRNEVKNKVNLSSVFSQMNGKAVSPEIITKETISQRSTIMLKNVRYGIEFHFEMTKIRSEHDDELPEKHYNILLRRLKKGECFRTPCMGCAEMPVRKIELVEDFDYNLISSQNSGTKEFGYMLYGLKFNDSEDAWDNHAFSDEADAVYYKPCMVDGVIDVAKYREGLKC